MCWDAWVGCRTVFSGYINKQKADCPGLRILHNRFWIQNVLCISLAPVSVYNLTWVPACHLWTMACLKAIPVENHCLKLAFLLCWEHGTDTLITLIKDIHCSSCFKSAVCVFAFVLFSLYFHCLNEALNQEQLTYTMFHLFRKCKSRHGSESFYIYTENNIFFLQSTAGNNKCLIKSTVI